MSDFPWCLIDTETTGLQAPIFVVEIAAQRMRGWQVEGEPFRRLLNHGTAIPPEASRVHGYTREILERDGDDPRAVYRELAEYVGNRPLCAYNLRYDWDEVLLPEWQRLEISPIGVRGFCLYELTQRLLDPVPAGNCKLQTLRQYYGLPARGAHTALGDVETVVDLVQQVLRPLCEARGLKSLEALQSFTAAPWFPARIPFGKFKGRHFREAATDPALREWLTWLAESQNPRSQAMGRWYLEQMEKAPQAAETVAAVVGAAVVVYANPDVARMKALIEAARQRLAALEAEYTTLRQAISVTQARLFEALKEQYRQRDLLRLRLELRQKYLDTLLREGEEEAQRVNIETEQAEARLDEEYERTAQQMRGKQVLSEAEEAELKQLWRRLVRLFHPDRYANDPDKQQTYDGLVSEINRARDEGDIERLREIARDPQGFIARQGWGELVLDEHEDLTALERLHESLQGKILELIEALDGLKASPEHELHQHLQEVPEQFDAIVADLRAALEKEIATLDAKLAQTESEIAELLGVG
jgi:DNA polymerase-3 subunit epsilon